MISIVYVSTAARRFSDEDVAALLRQSRESNTRRGLTGLLLFKDRQFMQVLEGDEDQVDELYGVIADDPRHMDVRQILRAPITVRQFPEWSMSYRGITDESIREIPGYDGFLDDPRGTRKTWADPTRAQWLLDWFRIRAA